MENRDPAATLPAINYLSPAGSYFLPDPQNLNNVTYCSLPACSKAACSHSCSSKPCSSQGCRGDQNSGSSGNYSNSDHVDGGDQEQTLTQLLCTEQAAIFIAPLITEINCYICYNIYKNTRYTPLKTFPLPHTPLWIQPACQTPNTINIYYQQQLSSSINYHLPSQDMYKDDFNVKPWKI